MYICVCNAVTEQDIRDEMDNGAKSLKKIQKNLCVGANCGRCLDNAKQCIQEHKEMNMELDIAIGM